MSDKRFYWLKLQKDFFKRHDIKYIQTLPDGYLIAFFYLKLMVESVDHDGELRFSPEIPYTEAMLASVTDTPIEIVTEGLKTLKDLGMVIIDENGTISIPKVIKMIGSASDTDGARRVRRYREKQQTLQNVTSTLQNVTDTVTKDNESKSKSKSKSIERTIQERPLSHFVPPSVEEVQAYCVQRENRVDPERFVDFYESKNWFIGKNKMRDWRAAVRTWEKRDTNSTGTQKLTSGNEFTALLEQEGYV